MNVHLTISLATALILVPTAHALDDFNVQAVKVMHEELSLNYDIYTRGQSNGWDSKCAWFQKPGVSLRFDATHMEHSWGNDEINLYRPSLALKFRTVGGIDVGLVYGHGFMSEDFSNGGLIGKFRFEGDVDSVGGYFAKQFPCGFKVGGTWSYSSGDAGLEGGARSDFDDAGGSASLGFARSFGEKRFGQNVFVDTSANFLYQSEEEAWYFLWVAKLGHSVTERVAIYGVFNLYHQLDRDGGFGVPLGFSGFAPFGNETWGDAGGGIQARVWGGLGATLEATTPVLNDNRTLANAFQIRAGLHFQF